MLIEFELIEKARSGDDAAFNLVVTAYRKRILGTIARLIGRPEDVDVEMPEIRGSIRALVVSSDSECGLRLLAAAEAQARKPDVGFE